MKKETIILASTSSRRKELLRKVFPQFKVVAPCFNEEAVSVLNTSPYRYVQKLAKLKAEQVIPRIKDKNSLVISADTVVFARGKLIGKPKNKRMAFNILKELRGTVHSVITGICIIKPSINKSVVGYEETKVKMKNISDLEIKKLICSRRHFDKAGGYAIQESGDPYIRIIKGSMSNAVGLPLGLLRQLLAQGSF